MANGNKELLMSTIWRVEEKEEKFKDTKLKVTNQPGTTPTIHVPGKKKYKNDDVSEDSLTKIDPELHYSFQHNFQFLCLLFWGFFLGRERNYETIEWKIQTRKFYV
ncbi:uncharacterized protein Fot_36875 [Forsythia ovata]|uniref:Uncharacterized protein n=1 Tax=Forsythia ovata TaxID=205694 RepID=A0ABD1SQP3_9LAMI